MAFSTMLMKRGMRGRDGALFGNAGCKETRWSCSSAGIGIIFEDASNLTTQWTVHVVCNVRQQKSCHKSFYLDEGASSVTETLEFLLFGDCLPHLLNHLL